MTSTNQLSEKNTEINSKIAAHEEAVSLKVREIKQVEESIDSSTQKYFNLVSWLNYFLKLTK